MWLSYIIFLCFLAKITPLAPSFFLQQSKMGCLISIRNSRASGWGGEHLIEGGWLLEKVKRCRKFKKPYTPFLQERNL